MDEKKDWQDRCAAVVGHYFHLEDGGFDEHMGAYFVDCNYEEQSMIIGFPTFKWQLNERGGIHGGALAGMFDTGLGVAANFVAGVNEAATTDMSISFLRTLDLGTDVEMKVWVVKAGKRMIRLRAELCDPNTKKLIATASGSWMPL